MDFVNNSSPQQAASSQAPQQSHQKPVVKAKRSKGKLMRIMTAIILVLGALLIGLLALYAALGGDKAENKYVDSTKFQAVFLNGGQVYFGKIRSLNTKFITIDNIYYLRVNQQVQPNQKAASTDTTANQDVSLAKLGCELHGPTDVMVINRDQVLFWENLKTDGQVSKAISDYVKANPKGQDCTTATGAGTTTPAATDPTKK